MASVSSVSSPKSWFQASVIALMVFTAAATAKEPSSCRLEATTQSESLPLETALHLLAKTCDLSIALPDSLPDQPVKISGQHQPQHWLDQWLKPLDLHWQAITQTHFLIFQNETEPRDDSINRHIDSPIPAPILEEMLVVAPTGSHLRNGRTLGALMTLPAPVLGASEHLSLGQTLRYAPQTSAASSSVQLGSASNASASVALRGLPANNTLVLIDGQRTAGNGYRGDSVDLNSIPTSALTGVDILSGSHSAIYGSGAMAGTVNFHLRKHFDGLSFTQSLGQSDNGDLTTRVSDLLWGKDDHRWSRFIAITDRNQEGLSASQRELSASADARFFGGIDNRSTATANSRIYGPDQSILEASANGYRLLSEKDNTDYFDYAPYNQIIAPLNQQQVFIRSRLQIDPSHQWDTHLSYSRTRSQISHAPTPIETATLSDPIFISRDNDFNLFGQDLFDVRRRLVELGPREQESQTDNWRLNSQWLKQTRWGSWSATGHYSVSEARQQLSGVVDSEALALSLGPDEDCQRHPHCIPLNLLGHQGTIYPEQLKNIASISSAAGQSRLASINLEANTGFEGFWQNASGIDTAIGLTIRQERSQFNTDKGPTRIGASQFATLDARRDIIEVYAEAEVGLYSSTDHWQQIYLSGALRGAHYSDFGRHWAPQLSLNYELAEQLHTTLQYARGYRAPSLIEQYQTGGSSQIHIYDPCSGIDFHQFQGCSQQSDPYQRLANIQLVGNRQLSPEQSEHFGASLTWQKDNLFDWLSELDITLGYFKTYQSDVITAINPSLLTFYDAAGWLQGPVVRDSSGNIQMINSQAVNAGQRELEGIDYHLHLFGPLAAHWQWQTYIQASQMLNFQENYLSGLSSENYVGSFVDVASGGYGALPEWKLLWGIGVHHPTFKADLFAQYISGLTEAVPQLRQQRQMPSWQKLNLRLNFNNIFEHINLELAIDNLFDEQPPFSAAAATYNFDTRSFDVSGRYYRFNLHFHF